MDIDATEKGLEMPATGMVTHNALDRSPHRSTARAALRSLLAAAALALLLLLLGAATDASASAPSPALATLLAEGTKFTPEAGSAHTGFGFSVAISADGNTALIGAQHSNGAAGAAWIFTRSGGKWTQQGPPLTGVEDAEAGEAPSCDMGEAEGPECGFGRSLALSADGNTALIGSPADRRHRGAAWIFTRTEGTWSQQGPKLLAGEPGFGSSFGRSVALSSDGDTALIGAAGRNGQHSSAVWVYTRVAGAWAPQGGPLLAPEGGDGLFGRGVALSADGNTALIGDPGDDEQQGALWVFARTGASWAAQGPKLTASDEAGAGGLGTSVALSSDGNEALAGARSDGGDLGAAWAFARSGTSWSQQGAKLLPAGLSAKARFGYSVALAGNGLTALIGAPTDANREGSVWSFARTGATWAAQGTLAAPLEIGAGWLGASVALSGSGATALVGGVRDSAGAGAVWSFFDPSLEAPVEEGGKKEGGGNEGGSKEGGGGVEPTHEKTPLATTTKEPPITIVAATGALATSVFALPAPVFGASGNLALVSGKVRVKLPGTKTFVNLVGLRQVPFGTLIDARKGRVTVTTVSIHGTLQTITFYQGEFTLTQARNGVVFATLFGGDFKSCPRRSRHVHLASVAARHSSSKHVVRKLWSEGHGSYTTKGNYASGAVLGTRWLTEDRCDGTLIKVYTDKVAVTNLHTHKRHIVLAGHSQLVKAP